MQHKSTIGACAARGAAVILLMLLSPCVTARHHPHAPASVAAPGHFDYYLLSLSWSPTYCVVHPDDHYECQGRGFGFVLHGLWPQYNDGGYPQSCQSNVGLDREAEAVGRTLYPSPSLMAHEWQQHGSCSGLDPTGFFRTADKAMAVVRLPAILEAPRSDQHLTVAQILDAFQAANPALPPHAMAVGCSRAELSEVRVCLTRNLQPRPCGRGVHDNCPAAPLRIRSIR